MSTTQSKPKDYFKDYFVNFYVPPEQMWQDFLVSLRWANEKIPADDVQGINQITSGVIGVYDPGKNPVDYSTFDQNKSGRFLVQNTSPFVASAAWGGLALTQQDIDTYSRVYFVWETDGVWTKYTELPAPRPSEYDLYLETTQDSPPLNLEDWLESRKGESATLVLSNWTDGNYIPGSDVAYKGVHWTAPGGASLGDVPGESDKWSVKIGDKPEIRQIPATDYIENKNFQFNRMEEVCICYDKETKLLIGQKLKSVRIFVPTNYSNTGEIRVVAIDLNENVKQTLNVTALVEGINIVTWDIQFEEDVYVGLQSFKPTGQPGSARPGLESSTGAETRRTLGSSGIWQDWPYAIGCDILIDDYTETARAIAEKAIYIINTGTSQLNAKLARGGVINLDSSTEYVVDDVKTIKDGTILHGNLGKLKFAPGLNQMFNLFEKEDVIVNNLRIYGSYPSRPNDGANLGVAGEIETIEDVRSQLGIGAQTVFKLEKVRSVDIVGNRFYNISAKCITGELFNKGYIDGVAIQRNIFRHCYMGLELKNEAEYCRVSDNIFAHNQINIWNGGGNNDFSNNQSNGGRVNFYVAPGVNDGHGSWVGGSLNHAAVFGILCDSLENGFVFSAISNHAAPILIYRSKGVQISGSRINNDVFAKGLYHPLNGSDPVGRNVLECCILNGTVYENWQGEDSYLILRNNRKDVGAHASGNNNKE